MNMNEFKSKLMGFDRNTNLNIYTGNVKVEVNGVILYSVKSITVENNALIRFFMSDIDVCIKINDLTLLVINNIEILNDESGIYE